MAASSQTDYVELARKMSAKYTENLKEQIGMAGLRAEKDVLYSTLEDFSRAPPDSKRMVVIGCTGAGKSTLLNIMGGWRFVQKPPDYEFVWEEKNGVPPLFKSEAGDDSVTKKTGFGARSPCARARHSLL